MSARKRRDVCKVCKGPVYVLAWAKKKPRQCYGCAQAKREAKREAKHKLDTLTH